MGHNKATSVSIFFKQIIPVKLIDISEPLMTENQFEQKTFTWLADVCNMSLLVNTQNGLAGQEKPT